MESYKLHISGERIPPFRGIYFRPVNGCSEDTTIFNHINNELDQNKNVFGLRKSELESFILLANLHNIDVILDCKAKG